MVLGEISTKAKIDFQQVIRDCIQQIGYDESNKGVPGGGGNWLLQATATCEDYFLWFACVHWRQSLPGSDRCGWMAGSDHLSSMSLVDTHNFPCQERPSVPGSTRVVAGGTVSLNQCASTRVLVS